LNSHPESTPSERVSTTRGQGHPSKLKLKIEDM
jgi:hypothetical protein